jgi:CBS domain-containing protein
MKIRDIMTRSVEVVGPDDSIQDAAKRMSYEDCGVLPVGKDDRLVGMITDRDIVTRAVARGFDPDDCAVGDIMSVEVKYVYDDESVDDLARNMAKLQVKRLPVLDRNKRLVGIVSLGDIALAKEATHDAVIALSGISRPGYIASTGAHI